MGRVVALAVRTNVGEGVAQAGEFARHRLDRLFDRRRVVDVAGVQLDEALQRRAVDLGQMRSHRYAGHMILRALVDRDRDDVAFSSGL